MEQALAANLLLPHLDEEDFERMRIDTRKLVVENELLKKRVEHLECQIVTHAWAGWDLH